MKRKSQSIYHKTSRGDIHYIKESGKGIPIIAIHGVGSNHTVWKEPLKGFANPKILIDLHGHGKSTKQFMRLDAIVDDIIKLLAKERIKCPIIIGNSLGSSIAVRLSGKIKPSKLILIGPFFRDVIRYIGYVRPLFHLLGKLQLRTPIIRFVDYSKTHAPTSWLYPFIDLQGTTLRTWMAGSAVAMGVRLAELSKEVPTLIIFGTKDRFLSMGYLYHHLRQLNASAIGIDCDHLVLYNNPKETSSVIRQFLKTKRAA